MSENEEKKRAAQVRLAIEAGIAPGEHAEVAAAKWRAAYGTDFPVPEDVAAVVALISKPAPRTMIENPISEDGELDPQALAMLAAARAKTPVRRAGVLRDTFNRYSSSGSGGPGKEIPRRFATFTVDHTVCAVGVFAEDFELTLISLTPELELRAASNAKADPIALAFWLARLSMHSFNGEPIGPGVDDWLWDALDYGGRQLVVSLFAAFNGTKDAAGKATSTLRVH